MQARLSAPMGPGSICSIMTWVVAHANPIVVVMMSDIQISVADGGTMREISAFGVKKIHHVAPTVFAGFAGSIVLGFRLIENLASYLDDEFDPNISTFDLTEGWASRLPERIASFVPPELARMETDILVAGMHLAPVNSADGTATDQRRPFGTGCKVRLLEPATGSAELEKFSWRSAGVSVGSGSEIPEYTRTLAEVDWTQFSNWEDPAAVLTTIMNMTIESAPTFGVSSDLISMMMKQGPDGIIGTGQTLGSRASNRSLIAEDEHELYELWERLELTGKALMAMSIKPPSASPFPRHPEA